LKLTDKFRLEAKASRKTVQMEVTRTSIWLKIDVANFLIEGVFLSTFGHESTPSFLMDKETLKDIFKTLTEQKIKRENKNNET
jgi:hypothetical protein